MGDRTLKNGENTGIVLYATLLSDIKTRIRLAQVKATVSANAEMIRMYWDIGRMIHKRQQQEGWSAAIIPHLSRDLRNELPEVKGFSERNLGRMLAFFRNYKDLDSFLPQAVAKSESSDFSHRPDAKLPSADLILSIPWGHHALLMEKIKDNSVRFWYMEQIIRNGWSRDILGLMIKSEIHERQGSSTTNFRSALPDPQSDLAQQSLKDPYIFDFLTLTEPFNERELETELVKHLEKFLLELGTGFAFVGRQYHLAISESEYELTRALPENLRSSLPSIEELEAELGGMHRGGKRQ